MRNGRQGTVQIVKNSLGMDPPDASVKWQLALMYLEYVVIFLKKPGEHIGKVKSVLYMVRNAGVKLKIKRVSSFMTELTIWVTLSVPDILR